MICRVVCDTVVTERLHSPYFCTGLFYDSHTILDGNLIASQRIAGGCRLRGLVYRFLLRRSGYCLHYLFSTLRAEHFSAECLGIDILSA